MPVFGCTIIYPLQGCCHSGYLELGPLQREDNDSSGRSDKWARQLLPNRILTSPEAMNWCHKTKASTTGLPRELEAAQRACFLICIREGGSHSTARMDFDRSFATPCLVPESGQLGYR